MHLYRWRIFLLAVLVTVLTAYAAQESTVLEEANREGKVIIYSTTDTESVAPLIKGFEVKYPSIKVEYNDMNSTELYNRYISEQAAAGSSGDVLWSSSMDTAFKLATQYALAYESTEIAHVPAWSVWQNKAYGTTYEPLVFIYNKRLLQEAELPTTHSALAALISSDTTRFKNKVTTYDIEKSAVGFMLAIEDMKVDPDYFTTLKAIASAGLILQSSTGTMMERVSSGENMIGYNVVGSYAVSRAQKDPSLGVIYPTDYTLVLSRVMFISQKAKNLNAAKLWLDYVLSQEGQDIMANQGNLTSIRDDVPGDNDVDGMTKLLGTALTPLTINEGLLEFLEQKKRLEFIKTWRTAAGK